MAACWFIGEYLPVLRSWSGFSRFMRHILPYILYVHLCIHFIFWLLIIRSAMGKSRSAAVCIAYLLHQKRSALTPQSALALIRESRPLCEPNPGFMEQLNVYHQMGCPDDVTSHTLYSRWLYRREVEESVACGRAPEMESVLFEDEQPQKRIGSDGQNTEIKCRRCRSVFYFNSQLESLCSP